MRDCVFLLAGIGFLYYWSWFYSNVRRESIMIEVNKRLAGILGFIRNGRKISIVSIILGMYAHISIILFLIFVVCTVLKININFEQIAAIWVVVMFLLYAVGEEIETCIKIKMAETVKQRVEFIFVAGIVLAALAVIIFSLYIHVFQWLS